MGPTVGQVVALARGASMSTTYKPALLKAIVRITKARAESRVTLAAIGAEFVRLYWVQTVVFRLRQAAVLTKEPEVVKAIRGAAAEHGVRRLEDLPAIAKQALEGRMARILQINVLRAFHRSRPAAMPALFDWIPGADSIDISHSSLVFLTSNASALEAIANLWWARYLEQVNLLAPCVIEKVERDGAERRSLVKFLALLRELDGANCFYCRRPLSLEVATHVDHVIPWSFLLNDPLWDLVLACEPCNLSKSDVLPDRSYLARLATANERRAKRNLPTNIASPLVSLEDLTRFYEAAVSVEWPTGWSPQGIGA